MHAHPVVTLDKLLQHGRQDRHEVGPILLVELGFHHASAADGGSAGEGGLHLLRRGAPVERRYHCVYLIGLSHRDASGISPTPRSGPPRRAAARYEVDTVTVRASSSLLSAPFWVVDGRARSPAAHAVHRPSDRSAASCRLCIR